MILQDKKTYSKVAETQPYCQMCGRTWDLHIHHIIYRSQLGNNDERNLIRLCSECHQKVHSNKKVYQPMLLEHQKKKYGDFDLEELKKKRGF